MMYKLMAQSLRWTRKENQMKNETYSLALQWQEGVKVNCYLATICEVFRKQKEREQEPQIYDDLKTNLRKV
jgi:hypothetical protein